MKATGIVRRIDDLGRIVIPKEIRRTLEVKEGDPLELYLDNEGGLVLHKYEKESYTDRVSKLLDSLIDEHELTDDEKFICHEMTALVARIEAQG